MGKGFDGERPFLFCSSIIDTIDESDLEKQVQFYRWDAKNMNFVKKTIGSFIMQPNL